MERLLSELQAAKPATKPQIDIVIDEDPVYVESSWSDSDELPDEDAPDDMAMDNELAVVAASQGLENSQLREMVAKILDNSNSESQLQSQLVDMVGFDHLDFIATVLSNRDWFTNTVPTTLTKEDREARVRENRERAAARNAELGWVPQRQEYPHVYRTERATTAFGGKYTLPQGTQRETKSVGDQVTIPPSAKKPMNTGPLVEVNDLDEQCRVTFSRYTQLNQVQSLVFPVGYGTNENMLVCAPTGAGKTDVALITMLKCFKDYGLECKIVYVAPLKALAAEITEKMGSRLAWMGVRVRELTGDMQLSRSEIAETHVLVTTPEKWDVVTRKPNDDSGLAAQIRLLIIDEVHLLHEDRGAVIESLVARTLRQVESQQSPIRIVGLSATLPNFVDVAEFLRVNPYQGLFYFDSSFRPCPLEQIFIGVKGKQRSPEYRKNLDWAVYDHLKRQLRDGRSVMVFVHSRKDTVNAARALIKIAREEGDLDLFNVDPTAKQAFSKDMAHHSINRDLGELWEQGFGLHHAGMPRHERNLVEKMFLRGAVRVLCCTATLAWGVNLPAACVIIRGTQVYDASRGGWADLGVSDVIQIFGRAGRPQYEKFGTGILCTSADKLDQYLAAITHQFPIESRLQHKIVENMNAEISLGTVTNIVEAVSWLGYTYMFVRMLKAPQIYGLKPADLADDPALVVHRRSLVLTAARRLAELQMIAFDEEDPTETLVSKDLGRIASDFYLLSTSVEIFTRMIGPHASEARLLETLAKAGEFDGIKIRQEEQAELDALLERIPYGPRKSSKVETAEDKTNVLVQAWVSRLPVKDASLGNDLAYVAQNASRIVRAFFLLCLSRGWGRVSQFVLELDTAISRRQWPAQHPLLQFDIPATIQRQLEAKDPPIEDLKALSSRELGDLVHNQGWGQRLGRLVARFPLVYILEAIVRPLTSKVMRVELVLEAQFRWDTQVHGKAQGFWVWVMEDSEEGRILHSERLLLSQRTIQEVQKFEFAVPVPDKTQQLMVQVESDGHWLGTRQTNALPFEHLVTPEVHPIRTPLLKLRPLPTSALHNPKAQAHYKFPFFNPMQTMAFHTLYHSQTSMLLGSPTGSGKTIACEIAVWAALRDRPGSKVVYIAPMKALVKERVHDWKQGLCKSAGLKLVELTGDTNPGGNQVRKADILVTTPEKFDGVSRNWQTRSFVQSISLVIMDEVHLLASDRGAILEMIVARMNHMASKLARPVRLLGMSTAVANAGDLAAWLGVKDNTGLFNFPSSVRPVPLEMYIDGFPELGGFCPFMKSMNKPVFQAIKRHASHKPALVFVPSRRQTRLTAQDLIALAGQEDDPRLWLHMPDHELSDTLELVQDDALRMSLQFGIGIHHAGLVESDRQLAHKLFSSGKIQVLVATSTLAWGVNLPAYLVVIKGTQFFDAKIQKYRDMDLTDVLQMMGRAGRPAYDTRGVSVVFTKQATKSFYKYFLNLGFPVESSLHTVLADHVGAEIANGAVKSRQEILDFLVRTFLFRRVHANPTYYGIPDRGDAAVNAWLVARVDDCLAQLTESRCLITGTVHPTPFLQITSFYYISHRTMRLFLTRLATLASSPIEWTEKDVLKCLALSAEYDELAIRHNEDLVNTELSKNVRFAGDELGLRMVDPHVKAYLLIQARMHRIELPVEDYIQDTVSVLDQAIRILQALIDTATQQGLLGVVVLTVKVLRCIKQACLLDENMVRILPGVSDASAHSKLHINEIGPGDARKLHVPRDHQAEFSKVVKNLPRVSISETEATFKPRAGPVYCPAFYKPQVESWFVIHEVNGRIISLERIQRSKSVPLPQEGRILIMNDTIDIDYALGACFGLITL